MTFPYAPGFVFLGPRGGQKRVVGVREMLYTCKWSHNLANFMRTLALPQDVKQWSLTTLRNKLVKIGAKVVRHGRYVTFQLAEVAVPRALFTEILRLIEQLRPRPVPTCRAAESQTIHFADARGESCALRR